MTLLEMVLKKKKEIQSCFTFILANRTRMFRSLDFCMIMYMYCAETLARKCLFLVYILLMIRQKNVFSTLNV